MAIVSFVGAWFALKRAQPAVAARAGKTARVDNAGHVAVGKENRCRTTHKPVERAVFGIRVHETGLRLVDRSNVGERVNHASVVSIAPRCRETGFNHGVGAIGHGLNQRITDLGRPPPAAAVHKGIDLSSIVGIENRVLLMVAVAAAVIVAVVVGTALSLWVWASLGPVARRVALAAMVLLGVLLFCWLLVLQG